MNIQNLTVTSTGDVHVLDSLNAALLQLKVKKEANTTDPADNNLIVYVDNQPSNNPSSSRRQFIFELDDKLKYYNQTSDEFILEVAINNNDAVFNCYVERKIGDSNEILVTPVIEEVEEMAVVLLEGENYIYTNYPGASITVVYPKDIDNTRLLLLASIFAGHRKDDGGDFTLDDIYFKDAFTKVGNSLNIEVNNASVDCISSNMNNFSLDQNGNLTTGGNVSCASLNTGSISSLNNKFNIDSNGNTSVSGTVTATGNFSTSGNISASGTITATGNITGNELNIYSITSRNSGKFSMDSNGNLSVKSLNVNGTNITGSGGMTSAQVVNLIYPVGSIYMSVTNTSPASLFGGTWVQLKDRFLLGAGDTYSNGNTGGGASHTHTLGAGYTQVNAYGNSLRFKEKTVSSWTYNGVRSFASTSTGSGSQTYGWQLGGSTDSSSSLPPYLVVYMWKRTA